MIKITYCPKKCNASPHGHGEANEIVIIPQPDPPLTAWLFRGEDGRTYEVVEDLVKPS